MPNRRQVGAYRGGFSYGAMAMSAARAAYRNRHGLIRGARAAATRVQAAWRGYRQRAGARSGNKRSRTGKYRPSAKRGRRSAAVSTNGLYDADSGVVRLKSDIRKYKLPRAYGIVAKTVQGCGFNGNRTYNVDCTSGRRGIQYSYSLTRTEMDAMLQKVVEAQSKQVGIATYYANTKFIMTNYRHTYQGVNNSTAPLKLTINTYRYKQDSSLSLQAISDYTSNDNTKQPTADLIYSSAAAVSFDLMKDRTMARYTLRRSSKRIIHLKPGQQFKYTVGMKGSRLIDWNYAGGSASPPEYNHQYTVGVEFCIQGAVAFENTVSTDISTSMAHLSIIDSMSVQWKCLNDMRRQDFIYGAGVTTDSETYGLLVADTDNNAVDEGKEAFINMQTGQSTVYSELR